MKHRIITGSGFEPSLMGVETEPSADPENRGYNVRTDHGLASTRNCCKVRSHAEAEAAKERDLPLSEGLSTKQPLAGGGNDQFPFY